jgi:cyclohexanone monooxygenase
VTDWFPSNDYYPAIARPNVSLVTEKIIEFRPDAVVTADGGEHRVDTVILATGFHVTDNPTFAKVAGTQGRALADAFGTTYLGTVVPGFPNYFNLTGANTGLGHSSMLLMIESQLNYIADGIAKTLAGAVGSRYAPRWPPPTTPSCSASCRKPSGAPAAQAGTWTARAAT